MNLQCSSGLIDTLDLKEEFYFDNQNWTCHPLIKHSKQGRRNTRRNPSHNHDCELEIANVQVSDSGYYRCSVYIPGQDSPLMSRELQLQVVSSLSTDTIIEIGLGVILAALLLILITFVVYNVRRWVLMRRRDPERRPLLPNDQNGAPQPPPQPPLQPPAQPLPQPPPQPPPLPPNGDQNPNGDQHPQPQPQTRNGDQQTRDGDQQLLDADQQPRNGDQQPQPLDVEAGIPQQNGKFRRPECPSFPGPVHKV